MHLHFMCFDTVCLIHPKFDVGSGPVYLWSWWVGHFLGQHSYRQTKWWRCSLKENENLFSHIVWHSPCFDLNV